MEENKVGFRVKRDEDRNKEDDFGRKRDDSGRKRGAPPIQRGTAIKGPTSGILVVPSSLDEPQQALEVRI